MPAYLFLLHERPAEYAALTPAQMQEIVQRYQAWAGELAERGQLAGQVKDKTRRTAGLKIEAVQ